MTNVSRFALLLTLGLAACSAEGQRAAGDVSASNTCPVGEQCSSSAPQGLLFQGTWFGDQSNFVLGQPGPSAVATGGRETLTIALNDGGDTPDLSFSVSSTASVLTASADAPRVTVSGSLAGGAYVRITDQGTDLLQDRIWVDVVNPASVTLASGGFLRPSGGTSIDGMAILEGSNVSFVAAITDSNGNRLADEGTVIAPSSGSGTMSSWDTMAVVGFTGGKVTATLSAGLSGSATVSVVKTIDDITNFPVKTPNYPEWSDTIPLSGGAIMCFEPSSAGVPITAETFDHVTAINGDMAPVLYNNCFGFEPHALGDASMTVTIGAYSKTWHTTIVADDKSGTKTGQSEKAGWRVSPSQGERANAQHASEE